MITPILIVATVAVLSWLIVRAAFKADALARVTVRSSTGRTSADLLMAAVENARADEEGPELAEAAADALTYSASWQPGQGHVRLVPPIHPKDR